MLTTTSQINKLSIERLASDHSHFELTKNVRYPIISTNLSFYDRYRIKSLRCCRRYEVLRDRGPYIWATDDSWSQVFRGRIRTRTARKYPVTNKYMSQIQKVTIKTPFFVNLCFHILLLIVVVPMAIITAEYANATPTAQTCRIEWEDWFFKEIQPSPCTRYFPMFTKQEIARFNKYHLTK